MSSRGPPPIRRRRLTPPLQQPPRPPFPQPIFREPRPDGKDPGSGYDGPGETGNNKTPIPEQPDIKF